MITIYEYLFALLLLSLLTILACNPDDEMMEPKVIDTYGAGVYVINQGSANLNASVAYYLETCQQVEPSIFAKNNAAPLVSPLMDIAFVDNSKVLLLHPEKLIIADANTFEQTSEITGFTRGQKVEVINSSKAYIIRYNNLGTGDGLLVADLNNLTISKSLHPNRSSDEMHRLGPAIYLVNSGGDLVDSTITKFDATSDLFLTNIEVGKRPTQIVSDKNGDLWVMCEGVLNDPINIDSPDNIRGKLVKISNDEVVLEIDLSVNARHLTIDKDKSTLYFVNNNWTYDLSIDNSSLGLTPFIAKSFNGYKIDPASNLLYAANAGDFSGAGSIWVYSLTTRDTVNSFVTGNIPLGFEFR